MTERVPKKMTEITSKKIKMTEIIGKMTEKSTWKVSDMAAFYYYLHTVKPALRTHFSKIKPA